MDKKAVLLGENLGYEIRSTRTLFKGVQVAVLIELKEDCWKAKAKQPQVGMKNSPAVLESGEVLLANGMKAVYLDQT